MRTQSLRRTSKIENLELRQFQRVLEGQRDEVLRTLNRLGDEVHSVNADDPKDIGDICMTTLSREALFRQTSEQRLMVRMIEEALDRIQRSTFGACLACGDDINPRRLSALPWTQRCLRCQGQFEQGTPEYQSAERRLA